MNLTSKNLWSFGAGAAWAVLAVAPACADDVELFVGSVNNSNQARPNILFILDDSGSMATPVITQTTFVPTTTYAAVGNCRADRVYFTTGSTPPTCNSNNPNEYFERTALHCRRAFDAFAVVNGGRYNDVLVSYDSGKQKRWETLSSSEHTRPVECEDDAPDSSTGWAGHGSTASPTPNVYPKDGNTSQLWTNDQNQDGGFAWNGKDTSTEYWLYDGNYLNWWYGASTISTPRIQVMKDVVTGLLSSVNGVNVGLMNFSALAGAAGSEGGPVRYAMDNVATARASMQGSVNTMTATGDFNDPAFKLTPLSETLYEAGLYWMGRDVRFGLGNPQSVAASRVPGDPSQYLSPIGLSCQKNHVVLLTDGQPTYDSSASADIRALTDEDGKTFATLVGSTCDVETYPAGLAPSPTAAEGACLDELAEFLQDGDLSTLPGKQNVTTHTVGFTIDIPILEETAQRGGGKYYTATDTASLTNALTDIVTNIVKTQATFTSPSVSVNSFNRTRNLNDLYVSVFSPSATRHWPGNLKKYRFRVSDGQIVDAHDNVAVDQITGFFAGNAQSYWSAAVDGPDVTLGGAANEIPAARNVYTYLGNADLTAAGNRVAKANTTGITNARLGTGAAGLPTRDEIIDFVNGLDASDVDNDGVLTESRNQMGDPLHSQPASVIYGPTLDDAVIYFATNDGFLHAIDPTDGSEKWAFVPEEFLSDQVGFFLDSATATKTYGIDGSLRVQMIRDNDGVVESADGERVYLFFGMRRGGDVYYGLDVTNPDAPRVLWRHDGTTLPGIGQSWAAPTPARINISDATYAAGNTTQQLVLVIGGGYDADQDNATPSTDPTVGNSIYIIDSVNGNVLWRASNAGATQNFIQSGNSNGTMEYSIPADVKVIDLNTDGYADRMYAADMGGQVWRFDIHNGRPAASLTTGGVIAKLGSAASATPTVAETRRFYYSPDVASVNTADLKYLHVGIGSGHRPHPNSTAHQDRFYALRDYAAFTKLTQAQYDALTPIVDGNLVDITDDLTPDIPQDGAGWRFELRDGGWIGEKVLAEGRTFNNQVFFTTFRPGAAANANPCIPSLGTNRLYVMDLFDGAPVMNLDGSLDEQTLTLDDRYVEFAGSIAADVVFLFPSPDDPATCVGEECTPPPVACVDLFCLQTGFGNAPIRTFWSQESVD
jgi:type IV pilus assembly protein PilY1